MKDTSEVEVAETYLHLDLAIHHLKMAFLLMTMIDLGMRERICFSQCLAVNFDEFI